MAVIAGNWKMHHGPTATRDFFDALVLDEVSRDHEILIFPPSVSLAAAMAARPPRVSIGVQNIHWEDEGAFTGETSAAMARDAGATFALVGHSERRHVFGESDEDVRRKVEAALRHGLVPVVCVGETLEERRAGRVDEVIVRQLGAVLPTVAHESTRFLVAYEPVWAIGTGRTASPADASEMHGRIRNWLAGRVGDDAAAAIPILYGGSVKPDNAAELLATENVDGVLVGGASLNAADFARIATPTA